LELFKETDMDEPNLLMICLNAFAAVLVLLSVLAGVIRLLITVFPEKEKTSEAVIASAINIAVQKVTAGATVSRIEEIR